jgi:transposase
MEQYKSEGKSVVYIDESGFSHESTRSHGYAKIGKRCFGTFNWGAKGRTNAIGAWLNGLLLTVSLFSFNVNSDVFYAWMTQDLLPKVPVGSVIVIDNASFHKRDDIVQSIQRAGCIAEFLPPYSPDFNPIEHTWAQLKSIRNKMRCSIDELFSHAVIGHLFIAR